jgi:hypothetical protein
MMKPPRGVPVLTQHTPHWSFDFKAHSTQHTQQQQDVGRFPGATAGLTALIIPNSGVDQAIDSALRLQDRLDRATRR